MAKVIAWAVLCEGGDVHEGEESCYLFLADDQARDEAELLDDDPERHDCGPHRVVALGEVKDAD